MSAQTFTFAMDQVLSMIADRIAERVRAQPGIAADESEFYDSNTSPLGKRAFLAAARRGDFDAFKVGRRVLAWRKDVHAYIESKRRRSTRVPPAAASSPAELLARANVRLRGSRAGRP